MEATAEVKSICPAPYDRGDTNNNLIFLAFGPASSRCFEFAGLMHHQPSTSSPLRSKLIKTYKSLVWSCFNGRQVCSNYDDPKKEIY
ncbi:hypothetical protein RvY_11110 [Ramazzottius varieornatus]|uniref:Uncharacterized protein n=1 Tax=Ramazzottius varieornatus TaxID=947166 RepID=A0A1D1VKG6_RAMVA|nr:hypothetical protein RvY_11110 [Ramazzottius varieornatus]